MASDEEVVKEARPTEAVDDSVELVHVTEAVACLQWVILHMKQQPTNESTVMRSLYRRR